MATSQGDTGSVPCPLCGATIERGADARCPRCGMDAMDPAFSELIDADLQIRQLQTEYNDLMSKWSWQYARRTQMYRQLSTTRPPRSLGKRLGFRTVPKSPRYGPVPTVPGTGDAYSATAPSGEEWTSPPEGAASGPTPQPSAEGAVDPTPQPPAGTARKKTPARKPRIRRRLSAPTLLGIAGASMLITAAIVFIAVTWSTIFPLAQGLLVLATAAAIAWLALWLTRNNLGVSGGAVGVVAMAFAGVAIISFDRAETNFGDYALPIALLVSAASGYTLSRREVKWVGPVAALSLVASAASLAFAFARTQGSDLPAIATIVGVASGVAGGLTLRLWSPPTERLMVKVGHTAVVTLSVIPAGLELTYEESLNVPLLAAALLPVVVLLVAGRWIPEATVGPAVLVATVVAAAAVAGPTHQGSSAVAAGAIAAAVAAALARFAPSTWRVPSLVGVLPIAVGGLILVGYQIASLVTWAAGFHLGDLPPVIDEWAAVTCLSLAAGVAATRLWRNRPEWLDKLEIPAAILAIMGFSGLAFPVTDLLPRPHLWGLAIVLEIAGAATAVTALAWKSPRARTLCGVGGVAVGTLGALNAVWPLVQRTLPMAVPLALGLGAVIVLALCGIRWPRACLGPAAFLLPVFAASAAANVDHWTRAFAIGSAVVAAILWLYGRLPASWKTPILGGLSLPLAASIAASLYWSVPVLVRAVAEGAASAGPLDPWAGLTAAFAGAALAAVSRYPMPSVSETFLGVLGAVVTLCAASVFGLSAAASYDGGLAVTVAWTETIGAILAVLFALLWRTTIAKATSGYGAALLISISGLNGFVALGNRHTSLALALFACFLPIGLLILLGRWWPIVTLAPASLLLTGAAAAAAYRYDLGEEAMVACAIGAATVLLWAVKWLPNRFRLPAAAGLVPTAILAVASCVVLIGRSMAVVTDPEGWGLDDLGTEAWMTGAVLAAAVGVAAFLRGWKRKNLEDFASAAGALFAIGTASAGTVALMLAFDFSPAIGVLAATVTGVLLALTAWIWPTPNARWAVGIWGIGWATFCALWVLDDIAGARYPTWLGLGAVAVPVVIMAVASVRWPKVTLGSVTLLVSLGAMAGVSAHTDSWYDVAVAAAISVAASAWFARLFGPERREPVLIGAVPAAIYSTCALFAGIGATLDRLITDSPSDSSSLPAFSLGLVGLAGAAALTAWRPLHQDPGWSPYRIDLVALGWPLLPFILVVSGVLPHPWATFSALALGIAGAVAAPRDDAGWHVRSGATVACLGLGVGWAARQDALLPISATIAAVVTFWLAMRSTQRFRDPALLGAHAFTALAAGTAFSMMGANDAVVFGAAMAGFFAVSLGSRILDLDPETTTTLVLAGGATILIPGLAASLIPAGVSMLIAGSGWLGHAVLGSRECRWISSLVLSLGATFLLAGAGVHVIEAYTAVPAGTVLAIGLWWLAEDSKVRTLRALGPGLSLALVPSYFALALDPNGLPRTLALTAAALLLAFVGVFARWFAPLLATAVTAVTVSLTQVTVGSDIVPRWVSFAIVGSILIAIAATYEKLQKLK